MDFRDSNHFRGNKVTFRTVAATIVATLLLLPIVSFAQSSEAPLTRSSIRTELKQLERAGFQPGAANMFYPDELRAAEHRIRQSSQRNSIAIPLSDTASQ